jgi:chromosome segregation ATPase
MARGLTVWEKVLAAVADLTESHGEVREQLSDINEKLEKIIMSQQNLENDVTALTAVFTDIQGDVGTLVTDLTAIQSELAAGNPVDTSSLDALVTTAQGIQTSLDSAVAGITGAATPPAPPAPAQ